MSAVETQTKIELKVPNNFSVILLNDNTTTVEFVIFLLMHIFGKTEGDAKNLTVKIDAEGQGVAGIYSYEIAQQKQLDARELAALEGFPLKIVLEENA